MRVRGVGHNRWYVERTWFTFPTCEQKEGYTFGLLALVKKPLQRARKSFTVWLHVLRVLWKILAHRDSPGFMSWGDYLCFCLSKTTIWGYLPQKIRFSDYRLPQKAKMRPVFGYICTKIRWFDFRLVLKAEVVHVFMWYDLTVPITAIELEMSTE